jgi:sulfate adenylyltransferase subunit 2
MNELDNLLKRAERFAARSGLSLSTVSRKLLNDGKGLARLKSGGQVTLKTLEEALARLAALERVAAGLPAALETKSARLTTLAAARPEPAKPGPRALTHLDRLEAEAIYIMREVAAEAERPVMLYSIGKDSSVMLHLAAKAFHPARPPFPLLHVDTTWKFRDMYAHRDRMAKELGFDLIVHVNEDGLKQGVGPFTHGSAIHTDVMKTQALKQALDKGRFDVAFGGARRDEEKSRAKERIFSFRAPGHRWDPKNQRPELWSIYNARINRGETIRVFPISNWTELDVWQYIRRESIPIPALYFAAPRPVVERDGALIMVDDERMPLAPGESPKEETVRFRTLGCYPLTGAVRSSAATLPEIISEMLVSTASERQGRVIDHDQSASMEKKKLEGYF